MKIFMRMILVGALACGSACARPDWIEQTLVTVDVTGVWSGELLPRNIGGAGNLRSSTVSFKLEQRGSKVTGSVVMGTAARQGPIEGAVAGDVFRFKQTNGILTGELRVNGDEMAGHADSVPEAVSIYLRRVDSPARPSPQ